MSEGGDMEAALAVASPDGAYREVDGPGYARATVDQARGLAHFPPAEGTWGVVRAFALAFPGVAFAWCPLA